MKLFHLNLQIIGADVTELARNINSFVSRLKSLAASEQVEAIAAQFPGGTEIDKACIALCNTAIAATAAVPASVAKAEDVATAFFTKLKVDITQAQHASTNPAHNFGYYLRVCGAVIEDFAASI